MFFLAYGKKRRPLGCEISRSSAGGVIGRFVVLVCFLLRRFVVPGTQFLRSLLETVAVRYFSI